MTPRREQTLFASFRVAGAGIARSVRTQRNLRIHLVAGIIALVTAAVLRARLPFALATVAAVGLVLTAELLNCALEAAVDLAEPDLHPTARDAKDAAAGGVLVAAVVALALGCLALGGALAAGPEVPGPLLALTLGVESVLALACALALLAGLRRAP